MLGNGHAQTVGVDLLERVRTDHGQRHLPGDADDRDGIQLGIGDGRQGVGGSGAGGGEEHRRLAAHPGHALGDEPGPLLVPGQDVPDTTRRKGVVQGQIRPARYPGYGLDPLPLQKFDNDFRPIHLHGVPPCDPLLPTKRKTPVGSHRRGLNYF